MTSTNEQLSDVESLVRTEEAATTLGVSAATLRRFVRSGRLPVLHVLGRPRFRRSDLLALKRPI